MNRSRKRPRKLLSSKSKLALLPIATRAAQEWERPIEEKRTYTIQGKSARESEYNTALALERLGYEYQFQVAFLGGFAPGGIVLDFLVATVPLLTPLWVQSRRYHTGERRTLDLYQQAQLEELMGGQLNPPVELWDEEWATPETAFTALKRKLG